MKVLIIIFLLFVIGCRSGFTFFGAIGHQSTEALELKIGSQEADPNMFEVGRGIGNAIGAALGGGR